MLARSCVCSVAQPCQLPASSLTSLTCFSAANPASGDTANNAANSRASFLFIADLLLCRTVTIKRAHPITTGTLTPLLLHFCLVGLRLTQVDAFTDTPFAGNPAAVCLLPAPRDESWMQRVAREMNLSETAFLEKR